LKKIKVFFVLGTRPEVIKLAPLIMAFQSHPRFGVKIINTGQHQDMSHEFLKVFELIPDYDLQVMTEKQSLGSLTARIIQKLEEIFELEHPDFLFVQGDTTTALCGALSSFYAQIPLGHVEAGLRTGEKYRPFPEEMNRVLIARMVDLHFAPTPLAKTNLLKESIEEGKIFLTGNTVVDALLWILQRNVATSHPLLEKELRDDQGSFIIVVTAHRRENWGEGIRNIAQALKTLVSAHSRVKIFFPVHPNPVVKEVVYSELASLPRIFLLGSLEYPDFVYLLSRSSLVITDSGGVQEEAVSLGVPTLITRESTERPEIVEAGLGVLVGCDQERIVAEALKFMEDRGVSSMKRLLFGDGKASWRILRVIEGFFGLHHEDVEEFVPFIYG